MQGQKRNTAQLLYRSRIFLLACIMIFAVTQFSLASNYGTGDGLGISVMDGRITALQLGNGNIINFGGQTGGFYVRDYTPGTNGLPQNLDGNGNLLLCSDFDGTLISCEDCLQQQAVWNWSHSSDINDPENRFLCTDLDISPTEQTTVAELKLPKNLSGGPHYIGIYQDIILTEYPNPASNELFCLSFDLATASGFRASGEVENDIEDAEHRIIARVDWFESAGDMASMVFKPELEDGDIEHRIGTTEANVWETTNSWDQIPSPYEHPAASSMTSCGIRSYRPLNAQAVRVGVIVYGFMPNDGVTDALDDHAYFDNFAFHKAPAMVPVKHGSLLDTMQVAPLVNAADGTSLDPSLKMGAKVSVETTGGRNYLWIRGKIVNADDSPGTLPPRALDLGFSFPIHNHGVTWWDDMRTAENVYKSIGGYQAFLPFCMTGPVDVRPELMSDYQAYRQGYPNNYADIIKQRTDGTTVSAYPFSTLDIDTTEGTRGLAFGDDLGAESVPVSHFGYRTFDNAPLNRTGEYYIEFDLGVLEEGTKLHPDDVDTIDYTPFSFILFRCDDPEDGTNCDFRIAADDYQTDIFHSYFTRPVPPINQGPEKDWEYGGAFHDVEVQPNPHEPGHYVIVSNVFTSNADKFGLRYTQEAFSGDSSGDQKFIDLVDGCSNIGISTLVYNRPWQARFSNDPSSGTMNHYDTLCSSRNSFGYPSNPVWGPIYTAQKAHQLRLPGSIDLFSRSVQKNQNDPSEPLSNYYFPVLLVDDRFGGENLLSAEQFYMTQADSQIGQGTSVGLKGITLDNVFHCMNRVNHLQFDPDHLKAFVGETEGTLTYGINHLQPAIPQVAGNVFYLDMMSATLEGIDQGSYHGDGASGASGNLDCELISVNANNPQYGGSKHGIMRADTGGFESSVDGNFNRKVPSQNFRRMLARDKNMSRLIGKVLFSHCMTDKLDECEARWNALFLNRETSRRQALYEASWIALAWGFMPSVTEMFEDADTFYQSCIVPGLFRDHINHAGRSITNIFRELHLAGWRPRTKAEIVYDSNPSGVDLFVERFGDSGLDGLEEGQGVFFTVLNNDDLTLTQPHLAKLFADGEHAKIPLEQITSESEFEKYEVCEKDFECIDFPDECPDDYFAGLRKSFWLYINDATELGLMFGAGNITGRQLVYRPENNAVCNWTMVRDWQFTDGWQSDYYSIFRLPLENKLKIGGDWPTIYQQPLSIDHTVLYVFKFWLNSKVDNGGLGGGSERRSDDNSAEGTSGSSNCHYERYGSGWDTYDSAGYNGSVDVASAADPEACVYYSINTGVNGPHDVLAHFPVTAQATTAAQYDIFVTDYLEGPAREAGLGEPRLTTIVDQSDNSAYSFAADEDGFITLGTVDVAVAPRELKTIVIKLSPARDEEARSNPSALLVSDAVMIRVTDSYH